ncbi:MAG: hypothetical protein F4233_06145 [Rhodospirillaceae bacterium]|nr:hypothetical protein [Rhodospirillaceae bacterium]
MDSDNRETDTVEAGKAERRTPRSIRFREAEWERIEACAEKHSLAAAEFVRFAALSAVEGGCDACKRLAPLVETTFRATHIMVTKMRTDMLGEDRGDELDELVAGARAQQDRLLGRDDVTEPDGGN